MGRPATNPKILRDGYYIEIRNKKSYSSVKIRRENKKQMLEAALSYRRSKYVTLLGEIKNGRPIEIKNK